jgi:hypothetical protein
MSASTVFKKLAEKYPSPRKVQAYLRTLHYNKEEEIETVRSALSTSQLKEAHCLEACLLAAAILEHQGYPPILLCMDSSDNLNHAVFAFREKSGWGSIGRSREPGLHGRAPKYRDLKALALSYDAPFVDKTGSLIGYHSVSLDEMNTDWRLSKRNVWKVDRIITSKKYLKLKPDAEKVKKLKDQYLKRGPIQHGKNWW